MKDKTRHILWKLPDETPSEGVWQEVGPGVRWRMLIYSNGLMIRECDFKCGDCDVREMQQFIVIKPLWEQHGNGRGLLCPACFEKRLGRKLTTEDLAVVPANGQFLTQMLISKGVIHVGKTCHVS